MPIVIIPGKLRCIACAVVFYALGACTSSGPDRSGDPAARPARTEQAPTAPAMSPAIEAAAFLQSAGELFKTAEEDCYAAERCGSVEKPARRGSVAVLEDMPGCLAMRIPVCAARAEKLNALVPPKSLSNVWPDVVRARAGAKLERARITSELLTSRGGLPKVDLEKKSYWEVDQWAIDTKSRFADRYKALFAEEDRLRSSIRALNDWLQQNGACPANVTCTFEKVMTAAR